MLDRTHDPALLLIALTGGGKTLTGFLPALTKLADGLRPGLHTLYISPFKALVAQGYVVRPGRRLVIVEATRPVQG